MADGNDVTMV